MILYQFKRLGSLSAHVKTMCEFKPPFCDYIHHVMYMNFALNRNHLFAGASLVCNLVGIEYSN